MSNEFSGLEIAIIGMAGRFPGANCIDDFWNNLVNGVESISFFSKEELVESGLDAGLAGNPHYVKAKGILENLEYFDAPFFGYSPGEAEIMSPQVRLFHECAWEALEDAGYNPESYNGLIGVFAGASHSVYWEALAIMSGKSANFEEFEATLLNNKDFLSTRISYKLNLKGPSFSLFTGCSTSGVSIHQGCQSLLSGESHMVLAGGVSVWLPQKSGYLYRQGMIGSEDGHCRVFDAGASGTIFGDGVGVVVLKLLEDALDDRDHIYAVIKGTALNNDGNRKVGYAAPSTEGQEAVIQAAFRTADVEPDSIGYIEAHGTGTAIGDTIEIEALKRAFNTHKKRFCGIGSVKSNVGHLNTAAGMSGFIKTVLALYYRLIPPTLHFKSNPKIDFENSPFYVVTETTQWKSNGKLLRAGVNTFGIGGTNFHVVLEQAPPVGGTADSPQTTTNREYHLILLSANTLTALDQMTRNLADHFKKNPGINLADAAFTLQQGRKIFRYRRMLVCSGGGDAIEALSSGSEASSLDTGLVYTGVAKEKRRRLVFMFAGVGSQYTNMGLQLYLTESVFQEEMDRCIAILKPILDYDIKEILYPGIAVNKVSELNEGDLTVSSVANNKLHLSPHINLTEILQPALFALEYALTKLIMSWGIKPDILMGYSFGEYTAACIAGVFSLEDVLKLITSRARLIRQTPEGAMLSVPAPVEEVEHRLDDHEHISIAIDNGPSVIVAGTVEAIEAFEKKMKKWKYLCMRVDQSCQTRALHSKEMAPILKAFAYQVRQVTLNEPQIPFISNVTGKPITTQEATNPDYWVTHLRERVQFAKGIKELLKDSRSIFIEIGPGRDLSALMRRFIDDHPEQRIVNTIRYPQQQAADAAYLLSKIGRLWLSDVKIDWNGFYAREKRKRVSLPTYPFERKRYWIEGDPFSGSLGISSEETAGGVRKKSDISDWFYVPVWKQYSPLAGNVTGNSNYTSDKADASEHSTGGWLVFADSRGIGRQVAEHLRTQEQEVAIVTIGACFNSHKDKDSEYVMNPRSKSDYETLITEIRKTRQMPRQIIHFWSISPTGKERLTLESVTRAQDHGFYSLLHLVRALQKENITHPLHLVIITCNMQAVCGEPYLCPEQSTVLGAVNVIPQENPSIKCRSIDISLPGSKPGSKKEQRLIQQLVTELHQESPGSYIALRDNSRWLRTYEPIYLDAVGNKNQYLKEKGVYLVTGGLGRIGLVLAEYLVKSARARVVLTGRSMFPAREQWGHWRSTHPPTHPVSQKIRKILKIEAAGGKVLIVSANAANEEQMQSAVSQAEKYFGPVNGVIHAAGIVSEESFSPMRTLEKPQCEIHFQPKIQGLMVLEKVFEHKNLDFFIIMSSISSVLGGLGFSAYSAANNFMDSFLKLHNRESEVPWLGVNWDAWQVDEKKGQPGSPAASLARLSMNTAEGIEAFKRILSQANIGGQVIHSPGELQARIDQWITFKSLKQEHDMEKQRSAILQTRTNLSTPYTAPHNHLESEIVTIWQHFFGFDKLGIHDDFIELGGDSLKAISLAAQMNRKMNINLPIAVFFEKLTIEGVAAYIKHIKTSTTSSADVTFTRTCPVIEPSPGKEYYTTSIGQRKLFILDNMQGIGNAYNVSRIVTIEGTLHKQRLENSFRALIRRQESLRTSFHVKDPETVMKIHHDKTIDFQLEYVQLQGKDKENRENQPQDIMKHFSSPFDLSRPPLMRVKLVKLAPEKHLLFFAIHHIIADDVSMRIILAEVVALYGSANLPALKIQYKDYAQWQQKFLESRAGKDQEIYWLEKFAGEIPLLKIPTDYPRPDVQDFAGEWLRFTIDHPTMEKINKLGEDTGTTLYMILLAALNILLSRYTGQTDITIGSPVIGRNHEELHHIIGLFMNVLPMRNYPEPDKRFSDFLVEVKENALAAYENQECPFGKLVDKLGGWNDFSRNPLNDVELIMINTDVSELEIEGLRFIPYEYNQGTAQVDIALEVTHLEHRVSFNLMYRTKLFKRVTMERFINSFKEILTSITESKNILLRDITISSRLGTAASVFNLDQGDFDF